MDKKQWYRHKSERDVNAFAELKQACRVLLDNAQQQRPGWYYEYMASLVLMAFTFEAFLNHIGYALVKTWGNEHERKPWRDKLKLILSMVKVDHSSVKTSVETLRKLFFFRDCVAHGKPCRVTTDKRVCANMEDMEDIRRDKPLTEWEKLCNLKFALEASESMKAIIDKIETGSGLNWMYLHSRGHGYTISPEIRLT